MRFGVFEDFKWEKTLLVWGVGRDLQPLVNALDELAAGPRNAVQFDRLSGAQSIGGAEVSIEVADEDAVLFRQRNDGATIELRCSRDRCGDLANQLRSLTATPGQVGHQYIELVADQPIQIMVSAGEYPADLKPG